MAMGSARVQQGRTVTDAFGCRISTSKRKNFCLLISKFCCGEGHMFDSCVLISRRSYNCTIIISMVPIKGKWTAITPSPGISHSINSLPLFNCKT